MVILINNQPACLKKGASFDYISENSFFTGADGYSLSITFPLKGCARNLAIFGFINRKDANLDNLLLSCEIQAGTFHKTGSVSIVEINETEVKTQFLEGRSATNYHTRLDEIYLDEIDFGSAWITITEKTKFYMRTYRKQMEDGSRDPEQYLGHVYLPWVNNTSGNIQNMMNWNSDDDLTYQSTYGEYVAIGQPFFIEILYTALKAAGYKPDITTLEYSQWADLIICNALPYAWHISVQNKAFPHWTVAEFIEQVELLTNGEFLFDHVGKTVSYCFNSDVLERIPKVTIDTVVDTYKVEVEDADSAKNEYVEAQELAYADDGHLMSKYYSAPWVPFSDKVRRWSNLRSMKLFLDSYLTCKGALTHNYYKEFHYCIEEDTYFLLVVVKGEKSGSTITHTLRYQPVNFMGPRTDKEEPENPTEIKIVPVCLADAGTYFGDQIFLECGELDDDGSNTTDSTDAQTPAYTTLTDGPQESKAHFDKLYVAFWDGNYLAYKPRRPHPYIDAIEMLPDGSSKTHDYTLRLGGKKANLERKTHYFIDPTQKFTFSFLSSSIPDVKSIFFIHGKKYLAEKITATFTENGMQQLLKLTGYRMVMPQEEEEDY